METPGKIRSLPVCSVKRGKRRKMPLSRLQALLAHYLEQVKLGRSDTK
jgi:hypothetical protein